MLKGCSEDITGRLEGLLKLSQMEEAAFQLNPQEVNLTVLPGQVSNDFGLLAARNRSSGLNPQEAIVVAADKARLKEVFENLLSNALKYSYPDTVITIGLKREKKAAVIAFQDQGQGLSAEDMKKLFTKFARLSSVPTGKERSSGLGLSIVKALVELHGGKVWASSAGKDQGATFFVALPV